MSLGRAFDCFLLFYPQLQMRLDTIGINYIRLILARTDIARIAKHPPYYRIFEQRVFHLKRP